MKAALITRYGPPEVLRIAQVAKPEPNPGEMRIRVRVATVCAGDIRLRKADPFFLRMVGGGVFRPSKVRTPGMEFAGTVDAIGEGVSNFEVGDEVFGSAGLRFGTCAQYVCTKSSSVAARPAAITPEEAAAIPFGGASALYYLRAAGLRAGQKLLVYGASGSVGSAAVQLGRYFGAHVTGVCSTANIELVRSLGADEVIDYGKDDYSRDGPVYDLLFDTVGKSGVRRGLSALKRGGVYAFAASPLLSYLSVSVWSALTGRARVVGGMAKGGGETFSFLAQLVSEGSFRPAIDRTYTLSDIVAAHRYVEAGHKKGNVTILVT